MSLAHLRWSLEYAEHRVVPRDTLARNLRASIHEPIRYSLTEMRSFHEDDAFRNPRFVLWAAQECASQAALLVGLLIHGLSFVNQLLPTGHKSRLHIHVHAGCEGFRHIPAKTLRDQSAA